MRVQLPIFLTLGTFLEVHKRDIWYCSRRRVNIPTGDILDVIAGWPVEKQEGAKRLIEEVEDEVQSLILTELLVAQQAREEEWHSIWNIIVVFAGS